jgi:putative ABC transport system permease protein
MTRTDSGRLTSAVADAAVIHLRFAWRSLWKHPAFTAVAVLTMALGTGTTTAMFTVVHSVLLKPLPYREPDRLVVALHGPDASNPVAPADYYDYRQRARSFEQLGAAQAWSGTLTGDGRPETLTGLGVTANMFDLLGVPPAIGRTFTAGDDEPGRAAVAVLSHGLWTRRFGGDPGIVGRTILLDSRPYTVAGVMPPSFRFAPFWITRAEIWVPLDLSRRRDDRSGRSLRVFGRLRNGVSVASAQSEVSAIAGQLADAYPATNAAVRTTVRPLLDKVVAHVRSLLLTLLAMVGLVLLIACANLSNALLARVADRQGEMAVRAALGASGRRILAELLTESVLLAVLGSAAGVAVAWWGVHALTGVLPPGSLARQDEIAFDARVFLATAALAILAGVAAGVVPAWQAHRPAGGGPLQDSSTRTASEPPRRRRMRQLFVAAQVALALVLLTGAAMMGRTLAGLAALAPGFDVDAIAVATVSLTGTPSADPARRAAAFDAVRARLEALPGVASVSAVNHLPLAGDLWTLGYRIDGRPLPPGERAAAAYRVVQPGYFATMGVPLRRGREFTEADSAGRERVVVVNETMARRRWPNEDPLGKVIYVPGPGNASDPLTIVGVAADLRQSDWTSAPDDEVFLPYAQRSGEFGLAAMTFVVRTAAAPSVVAAAIPQAVAGVDPALPVSDATTMRAVVREELWRQRLSAQLTAVFAGIALSLAFIGVYAVVSYTAARRTREYGIRLALGATSGDVRRLALLDALRPVATGAAAGSVLAVASGRWVASWLPDLEGLDPIALAGAAALLCFSATVAAWIPARRASRQDAAVVLRTE